MNILKESFLLGSVGISAILTGCSLPPNASTPDSPIQPHDKAWFSATTEQKNNKQQGLTAYLALDDAFMSIAARLHLIRTAQHNLDLQYYIWKNDTIGQLMLSELLKAADRGVKIRLMIDDQNGTELDDILKALVQHPNVQIKLFNPYKYRHFRAIDYAFRLKQVNHRMHNKLIIADGAAAVTGGRNISREYFDASENFQFTDMDIFFAGPATIQANHTFQQFWNDELSYSVQQLLGGTQEKSLAQIRQQFSQLNRTNSDQALNKIREAQQQIALNLKNHPIRWAKAKFLADLPQKIRGQARDDQLIYRQMFQHMGQPRHQMDLVSAYFVPSTQGTTYLNQFAQKKIQVRVLTNSFMANDVALVHGFYQQYRYDLLKHGIKLYEFKPYIQRDQRTWYEALTGNVIPAKGKNASSLHAKFFTVDDHVFIGSFNFDPRSVHLNTEVGLLVESSELQRYISSSLDLYLPRIAYELQLNAEGKIMWIEHLPHNQRVIHTHDPETTKFQRFAMHAVSYLPIEWMM